MILPSHPFYQLIPHQGPALLIVQGFLFCVSFTQNALVDTVAQRCERSVVKSTVSTDQYSLSCLRAVLIQHFS